MTTKPTDTKELSEDEVKTLEDFHKKMSEQKNLDPVFQQFVSDHFWELIDPVNDGEVEE